MVLFRLNDFDTTFHKDVGGHSIENYDVYSDIRNDKVGSIKDLLVDESGNLRYLVIDTGFWVTGKQVLLPIGRCRIDDSNRRIYAKGLTKEQVEYLPEFDELERVNYDYEEKVRGVYRTAWVEAPLENQVSLDTDISLEASASLELPPMDDEMHREKTIHREVSAYAEPPERPIPEPVVAPKPVYNHDTYTYQQEPNLYQMNEQEHNTLKLYEERLIANKQCVKTQEVTVGKHVETETARISVPVEKERVVIERTTPKTDRVAYGNEASFENKQVAKIDIYEETPDIQKQAVVREEVKVTKVVEQSTVEAQEQVRREELDINTDRDVKNRRT